MAMTTRLPLCSAVMLGFLCVATPTHPISANILSPLGTGQQPPGNVNEEIVSQGTQSWTGDTYSQGMMAQSGPWAGQIYSQGMMMSTGEIYSQGTEITMQWEPQDTQPFDQGCDGLSNCTNNVTNAPASNRPGDQPWINSPLFSDPFGEPGTGPITTVASSGLDGPGLAPSTNASDTANNAPSSGPASGGSSDAGLSSLTEASVTANNDPPSWPAGSGSPGTDVPLSVGVSHDKSGDPIPEPDGLALFVPAFLLFGLLRLRRHVVNDASISL